MCRDILAGDITDVLLVAILVAVEHQARFPGLQADSEPLRAQEKPKLERQIEARQAAGIEVGPRMSWMPHQQSLMIRAIFSIRTSPASYTSCAQRGISPHSNTAKISARNSGR
jgi:hypothetical protein